ncbi:MAG: prepilin-type N-terminal cleavage/methylation domain-containing protein [Candidatus Omnitrophica bacterium]|nr:prepilin-type N-terminal cleavage/methylation domain-containing protein [Candidatus Omnitrophota bacterium]
MEHATSGFSLAEVLVVLLIISVLFILVMPQYIDVAENARTKEARALLRLIRAGQEVYFSEYRVFSDDLNLLNIENPNARVESQRDFSYSLAPPPPPDTLLEDFIAEATRLRGAREGDRYRIQKSGDVQGPFNP